MNDTSLGQQDADQANVPNGAPNPFLEPNLESGSCNVGDVDRIFRLDIAGMLAIFGTLWLPSITPDRSFQWIIWWFALIIGTTALTRNCPAYRIFGINTNRVRLSETVRLLLGFSTGMSLLVFGIVSFLFVAGTK